MSILDRVRGMPLLFDYQAPDDATDLSPNRSRADSDIVELVLAGRGWFRDDGRLVEAGPGSLLWHVGGEATLCRSYPAAPYHCLAVHFTVRPGQPRPAPRQRRWDDRHERERFAALALRRHGDPTQDREALTAWVFSNLLLTARQAETVLPPPLARALDHLGEHPAEDPGVRDLARHAGCSPRTLVRLFARHLGTSPHAYLMDLRLRLARERLAALDRPVTTIAAELGYASPAHFSRRFRAATGLTPTAWRHRQMR